MTSDNFLPPRSRGPFHKGLILVVEDDPDISKMLRIYLESQRYEVLLAKKGAEGVQICVQSRPDVVILDTSLPHWSAGGVYRKLRAKLGMKSIPVLFLSEDDKISKELEMLELREEDEIISKPFDIEQVKSYLERVIPQAWPGSSLVLWQSDEEDK